MAYLLSLILRTNAISYYVMKNSFAFLVVFFCLLISVSSANVSLIGLNNYGPLSNPIYLWNDTLAPAENTYAELWARVPDSWVPLGPVGGNSSLIKLTEDGFFDAGYAIIPGKAPYETTEFILRAWSDRAGSPNLRIMGEVRWSQKTGGWFGPPSVPIVPDLENPPLHFIPEPSTVVLSIIGGAFLLTEKLKGKRSSQHTHEVASR